MHLFGLIPILLVTFLCQLDSTPSSAVATGAKTRKRKVGTDKAALTEVALKKKKKEDVSSIPKGDVIHDVLDDDEESAFAMPQKV